MKLNTQIKKLADLAKRRGIKTLFTDDASRAARFSYKTKGMYLDLSKTHITNELIDCYSQMAEGLQFDKKRHELFSGVPINVTENRPALHTLLRNTNNPQISLHNEQDGVLAKQAQTEFLNKIDSLRQEFIESDTPIKNIVHIGIGGSSLGPQLLYEALSGLVETIQIYFVSNIDAHEVLSVLSQCEPESTLVFGVSKTFTTDETLVNINTIQNWYSENNSSQFWNRFFAVTTSANNAKKFGVRDDQIIIFPEWVGGRYSIWSSVSLSVALILGRDKFTDLLEGASNSDKEFYNSPLAENIPFLTAALDHFYVNYFAAASKATFAYDYRLRSLVPYLQQLETESNGKDRDVNGEPVQVKTSPVVWGGVGTDMQHSTFQLLHQGTHFIPVEFILLKQADHDLSNHHTKLLANAIAQSAALLSGRDLAEVEELSENTGMSSKIKKSKIFAGDKPSSTIVIDALTPYTLGALLSFYEHRTFCSGIMSNINSFDQMGVELGKQLANSLEPIIQGHVALDSQSVKDRFDSSTIELMRIVSDHADV